MTDPDRNNPCRPRKASGITSPANPFPSIFPVQSLLLVLPPFEVPCATPVPALSLLFLSLSITPSTAFAADWQQPTPEELKMTAEPAAPNADAIYLYREDVTDNKLHMEAVYVRLKILRDEGKKYGDVELTGASSDFQITDIQGRTIHSDGTVIPFTGKPYEKLLFKTKRCSTRPRSSPCPRWKLAASSNTATSCATTTTLYSRPSGTSSRRSTSQGPLPLHPHRQRGHLAYRQGQRHQLASLTASSCLRATRSRRRAANYDLAVENIPGLPQEEFEPPMHAFAYRVRFYYTSMRSSQEYLELLWQELVARHR